jgi:putative spermidine/putrescine transport system permease protein
MTFLARPATDTQITHARRLWLYAFAVVALVYLLAPPLIVIPLSFSPTANPQFPPKAFSLRWYQAVLASRELADAASMSVKDATLTMLIVTPIGTAAAYATMLARSAVANIVAALLTLPMMVPAILVGIGLYFVYVAIGLNDTLTGVVLAHVTLALPYVYVLVASRLKSYDFTQERAAQSLGATRFQAFLRVTLPQIKISIASAAALSFIFAFDESVVSYFIATGNASTLPRRLFVALQVGFDPTIAAVSTGLILFAIVVVTITQLMPTGAAASAGVRK